MNPEIYRRARLSRDHRFDGKFFIGVKTTGIYCRPICPASPPREENVVYFATAIAAANQGFRPCLRCRPDSSPDSCAWKGTDTTLERALKLIDEGALIDGTVTGLAERLGISNRYLTKLFQQKLGTSPKQYGLYQQLLFAKSLLQQTSLPISDIAFAAGFGSVRRFNDSFAQTLQLTPSAIRRHPDNRLHNNLRLFLSYRPPYAWPELHDFLQARLIPGLEWIDNNSYGRTFTWGTASRGHFTVRHDADRHGFEVMVELAEPAHLLPIIRNIRRVLDLDADIQVIDEQLAQVTGLGDRLQPGLRLPGIWSLFEAGVRAILGQQITVTAARNLVTRLVQEYGEPFGKKRLFPTPRQLADSDLEALKMPGSRRQTLREFARIFAEEGGMEDPDNWLDIKGIGPWTVRYAKMRGLSDSDIWLGSDLGVKRALEQQGLSFDPVAASPWQSYLTFHLWSLL